MSSDPDVGGLPVNAAQVVREVAGIATAPGGSPTQRAEALLAQVQRMVPCDAGMISLLPADQDAFVPLARSGYDERICGFLDGVAFRAEVELLGLRRSHRPLRLCDSPVPLPELETWVEYLQPAGLWDSVGVGLFAPEGRYLGVLGLNMQAADSVSEAARDALGMLAPAIGAAVDPWRALATIAAIVHQATAGIVLAPSGAVQPLPGLPDHRLLAPGSGVLGAATLQLAAGGPYASFLAPLPARENGATHARITVLAAPPDLRRFATAVVLLCPAGDLQGLSNRELQVLGLLVTGASNEQIARTLGITTRTVEVHVEHVRAKLAAASRTTAAARALRLGLFVPPFPLTDHHGVGT